MSIDELYHEVILDHFRNPRHRGVISNPSASFKVFNPLCGDEVTVSVSIENDHLTQIGCQGRGCSISQASASMMASACEGKCPKDVRSLCEHFRAMLYKDGEPDAALGDAVSLAGVKKFPARIRCALMAWEAVERCVDQGKVKES